MADILVCVGLHFCHLLTLTVIGCLLSAGCCVVCDGKQDRRGPGFLERVATVKDAVLHLSAGACLGVSMVCSGLAGSA